MEVTSSLFGFDYQLWVQVVVDLGQILGRCGIVISAAGNLGDLLQRGFVELGVDGETIDMQGSSGGAAEPHCVDAHAAVGSRLAAAAGSGFSLFSPSVSRTITAEL